MKLDICIPSHHRIEKLSRCLKSIENNYVLPGSVHVYFSDKEDYKTCMRIQQPSRLLIFWHICETYSPPDLWAQHLRETDADVMFLMTDDCELHPDTIAEVVRGFEEKFPDFDGVIGVHQDGIHNQTKGAMSATGIKFADRFIGRHIFCPDYKRFGMDLEYTRFAESVGRFHYDPERIRLIHHHPVIHPGAIDQTHIEVRKYLAADNEMLEKRQKLGYLWGHNFFRVGP